MIGALALLGAAGFAVYVGAVAEWLACENEGTPACNRHNLASAQFKLALIGLVPSLTLVLAAVFRRRLLALASIILEHAPFALVPLERFFALTAYLLVDL